ncbi:MAG: DUF4924 family protein [Draconibacterium sp.]
MLIAKQKRKENIAEYILYLFQIEDLIRAFQLDMEQIQEKLISKYQTENETQQTEITAWYQNLVLMMGKEGISEKGHFQFLMNLINELNEFHLKLMETAQVPEYVQTYKTIAGLITELKLKSNGNKNNIQISLEAIYGYLLLKMQQKEVTPETSDAVQRLGGWLGQLSMLFKDFEEDKLEFE